MRVLKNGCKVRHFKGKEYIYLGKAIHTETNEIMAVYQEIYDDKVIFVRPYEMFVSEIDKEKYPNINQKYRFEVIE